MKNLVIAIDCDDVLVDSSGRIVDAYNKKYKTSIDLDAMYNPNPAAWQASSIEEAIQRFDVLLAEDGILNELLPSEQAVEAVRRLAEDHELHLVTGRQDYLEPFTHQLVHEYFPNLFKSIEHTNYIASEDSKSVRRKKSEVCKLINADILVDDHIAHLDDVLTNGLKEVILFGDYPWNREVALPSGAVRCTDWDMTLREIERIASR